jgi:hypothetical protein
MRNKLPYIAAVAGCIALGASEASAQGMTQSLGTRIMAGPFVGVNVTTVSGSDLSNKSSRVGLAAGAQLQADFEGGLFFRTAALYSMRGVKATEDGDDATFKEDFVEVPLLLGYTFGSNSTTKPFVMAGAQVGFKVSCKLEGEDSSTSVSVDCDQLSDNVSSFDYGAVGGGGVMFPLAGGTVSIDARYYFGLKKIIDDSDADSKHRGLTAGVAFMIPFGH